MSFEHIVDDQEFRPKTEREYWQERYREERIYLRDALRSFFDLFISHCPDCHKLDSILWYRFGNHDDCIPF